MVKKNTNTTNDNAVSIEDLSLNMASKEQFERMIRWYNKFSLINSAQDHPTSVDHQVDEIVAFFMNCYHLKDWINNSYNLPILRTEVENYITDNECLELCGAVCIGFKHLENNQTPHTKRYGGMLTPRATVLVDESIEKPHVISVKFDIISEGTGCTYDAYETATRCVNKWIEFFRGKGWLVEKQSNTDNLINH